MKQLAGIVFLAFVLALGAFGQTPVLASQNLIQYTDDFTSVTYLDAAGQTVTVSFLDSARFSELVNIRGMQQQAFNENKIASQNYNQAVKNAQASVDIGREAPPLPTKPQQKVVTNEGKATYVDFNPPLLSIVIPVTSPSTGKIKSDNPTPDPAVQQQAVLTVIMNQLTAIIQALRAKGIM